MLSCFLAGLEIGSHASDAVRHNQTVSVLSETERPAPPPCPSCGTLLTYVETEISSGAFRTQAASMPQIPIHYYDCDSCKTCWKQATRLLPDPIRQILKS